MSAKRQTCAQCAAPLSVSASRQGKTGLCRGCYVESRTPSQRHCHACGKRLSADRLTRLQNGLCHACSKIERRKRQRQKGMRARQQKRFANKAAQRLLPSRTVIEMGTAASHVETQMGTS